MTLSRGAKGQAEKDDATGSLHTITPSDDLLAPGVDRSGESTEEADTLGPDRGVGGMVMYGKGMRWRAFEWNKEAHEHRWQCPVLSLISTILVTTHPPLPLLPILPKRIPGF